MKVLACPGACFVWLCHAVPCRLVLVLGAVPPLRLLFWVMRLGRARDRRGAARQFALLRVEERADALKALGAGVLDLPVDELGDPRVADTALTCHFRPDTLMARKDVAGVLV